MALGLNVVAGCRGAVFRMGALEGRDSLWCASVQDNTSLCIHMAIKEGHRGDLVPSELDCIVQKEQNVIQSSWYLF